MPETTPLPNQPINEETEAVIHVLKTWPDPFGAVWDGRKLAEFRRDDRQFRVGDWLNLLEYDPDNKNFSGREIEAKITDIRKGPAFGIPEGYAMLSLQRYCGRDEDGLAWEYPGAEPMTTPLPDRAARFASLATAERAALVTELADELEKATAERDKLLAWLVRFANAKHQRFDLWGPHQALADPDPPRWYAWSGTTWHTAPTALEAVRKAAGLDRETHDDA